MATDQAVVDRLTARVRVGESLGGHELLVLQAKVYRHVHDVELASKLVDKAGSAVRTTLQSQGA
jgi:hypothetical protein